MKCKRKRILIICGLVLLLIKLNFPERYIKERISVDEILDVNKKWLILRNGLEYSLYNKQENEYVKQNFTLINKLSNSLYLLFKNNEKILYNINNNKELHIEDIKKIDSNEYLVVNNNKVGVVDEELNIKIKLNNDRVEKIKELYLVQNKETIEILDNSLKKLKSYSGNEEILKLGIKNTIYFSTKNRWGIKNYSGEIIIEPIYDYFVNLNDKNILIGYIGDDSYIIDLDDNFQKKLDYDSYGNESFGKIMILKNNKIGYIDTRGSEVVPPVFDGGFYWKKEKEFIQLKKDGIWSLYNLDMKERKMLIYDDVGDLEEGLMVVSKDVHLGYIDEKGNEQIKLKYNYAENFKQGVAVVGNSFGYGVIDKKGRELLPLEYDNIKIQNNYIYVEKNNKIGLFNLRGKEILPIDFEKLGVIDTLVIPYKKSKDDVGIIKLRK